MGSLCNRAAARWTLRGFAPLRVLAVLASIVAMPSAAISPSRAADPGTGPPDASTEYLEIASPSDRLILSALDRATDFTFIQTPLSEFVDELNQKSGFNVKLDLKAMDDAGVPLDVPINCRLKNVPLRTALRVALADIGPKYYVKDGILIISSKDVAEAEENLLRRIYPIGDIVGDDFNSVMDVITETVDKNSWDENGGQGKIEPASGSRCLVISQTDEVQAKVLELLRALRTAHKLWPRGAVRDYAGHVGQGMM